MKNSWIENRVEPHAFVAEVYRRMSLRHRAEQCAPSWAEVKDYPRVLQAMNEVGDLLPRDKHAAILDVGFGSGWFLAASLRLGYANLFGADFGIENKAYVKEWAPDAIQLSEIRSDIGSFLADKPETYDFIHMSHVIEHIPKYSLLWVVDALYRALKPGGVLMLRTPNMEGPCANSSFYVTLAHEYGFSSGNLASLLDICGFDEIRFHLPPIRHPNLKQRLGRLIRWPFLKESEIRHRLFGVNTHGHFDSELIVTSKRVNFPPLFDLKYR
jgi:2-polyprenyl-3-methyl-5-hydroxy-6-metoxy-1,4-benzoquinol methylase